MNAVLPTLSQELGRSPTIEELAARAEASSEEVLDAMEAVQAYSTSPLEAPIGDEGTAPIDVLGEEDPSLELLERWASVAPAVQSLSSRERRVLHLRFFRGLTQSEIAEQIGVSQMHVSRILSQTLRTLREEVAGDGAIPEDEPRGSHPDDSTREARRCASAS